MGNRGVISTTKKDIALYLHWDGDITFVKGLLLFTMVQGARNPIIDGAGWCRMAQHYDNLVGCGRVGAVIETYEKLRGSAEWNNGEYVIDENWGIVERIDGPSDECKPCPEEIVRIAEMLDEAAPARDRLPYWVYMNAAMGIHPTRSYEELAMLRGRNPGMDIDEMYRPAGL